MEPMNRRDLFKQATALGLGSMFGMKVLAKDAGPEFSTHKLLPSRLTNKFYANGHVRYYPGNTFVCHLPQQGENSAFFYALLNIYREAELLNFRDKVTMLPTSSYHMTFLNGVTDERRDANNWPTDLPMDAQLSQCNDLFLKKLENFKLNCQLPIRMRVDLDAPEEKPFTLRLVPYDTAEIKKLLNARKQLAGFLNLKHTNLETYRFHSTLGYLITELNEEETKLFNACMHRWKIEVNQKCPVITLGAPEFCFFDDMYAFQRQMYLNT